MSECKCEIDWDETQFYHIIHCPMHKAAPELLEACRGLLDMITNNRLHGDEVYRASDAIRKAEGK